MRNFLRQTIFHKKAAVLSGKRRESAGFVNSASFYRVSWLSQPHPLTEFLLHTCGMSDRANASRAAPGASGRSLYPSPTPHYSASCYLHGHSWLGKLNCQQGLTEKLNTFWFLFLGNADLAVYVTAESYNKVAMYLDLPDLIIWGCRQKVHVVWLEYFNIKYVFSFKILKVAHWCLRAGLFLLCLYIGFMCSSKIIPFPVWLSNRLFDGD